MGQSVASFLFVFLVMFPLPGNAETVIKTERQISDGKVYEIWTERMSDGSTRERRMILLSNGSFMQVKSGSEPTGSSEKSLLSPPQKQETPVAIFNVNPRLFNDFGATIHQTVNSREDITTTRGSGTATVTVRPASSSNTIAARVDVSMTGSAVTSGSKIIPRKIRRDLPQRSVSVQMNNSLSGNASTTIYLDETGAKTSPISVNADISLGAPQVSSRGFVSPAVGGLARNVGRNQAIEAAEQIRPAKEAEIEAQLRQAMSDATRKVDQKVRDGVQKAATLPQAKDLGKDFTRTIRSSPEEGARVAVYSKTRKGDGTEAPGIPKSPNMAAEIAISEDFANQALTNKTSSMKKVKLSKALRELCEDVSIRKLALCALDLEGIFANIEVTFDENDPVKVSFRDGRIKLVMNAAHDMNVGSKDVATPNFQGNPYQVEVVYKVNKDGLVRESLSVSPRDGDRPAFDFLAEDKASGSENEGATHASAAAEIADIGKRAANRMVRSLSDPLERKSLEQAYEKALVPKVDFPVQTVPARMELRDPKPGSEPKVVGNLILSTGWADAQDGWFTARIDRQSKAN